MDIHVENLYKTFNGKTVLRNVCLDFNEGQKYCIMGPSGQGKTTLLRILMGLEFPDQGEVYINKKPIVFQTNLKAYGFGPSRCIDRSPVRFSAVFQEDRLCEWLDAVQNVAMVPLPVPSGSRISYAKEQLIHILPEESLGKPVCKLSGGMRRRVALVRAMAANSEGVILDEPFTGLDEETKCKVIQYILKEQRNRTLIAVSHQEEDAVYLKAKVVRF